MSTFPCPFFFQQWNVLYPDSRLVSSIRCLPLQKKVSLWETPDSKAASATNGFMVDPGGYWLDIDLLINGLYLFDKRFSQVSFEIDLLNIFGS